ncbi:MAG TPA: hypothetical protein PKJ46_02650 [Methanoculleus sp.]|nr:hypothetical protein [Methanoculleus sp.]
MPVAPDKCFHHPAGRAGTGSPPLFALHDIADLSLFPLSAGEPAPGIRVERMEYKADPQKNATQKDQSTPGSVTILRMKKKTLKMI